MDTKRWKLVGALALLALLLGTAAAAHPSPAAAGGGGQRSIWLDAWKQTVPGTSRVAVLGSGFAFDATVAVTFTRTGTYQQDYYFTAAADGAGQLALYTDLIYCIGNTPGGVAYDVQAYDIGPAATVTSNVVGVLVCG